MIVLVAVETLVLVLLTLLVAGLLRSHAEILRRLPPQEEDRLDAGSGPAPNLSADSSPPTGPARQPVRAPDIVGTTLQGDPVKIAVSGGGRGTLLAFLSTGCATCGRLWEGLHPARREPTPGGTRTVVVTRDRSTESPSRLRRMAPPDISMVMSSAAWEDYEVPMTPYFVYVGTSGLIEGEGVAEAWPQVLSLLRDALDDAEGAGRPGRPATSGNGGRTGGASGGGPARQRRIDQELQAAGIRPDDPSLYDAGSTTER